MGTVRASPKRSVGPKGRRWNRPRGVADIAKQAILRCSVKVSARIKYSVPLISPVNFGVGLAARYIYLTMQDMLFKGGPAT